MNTATESLTVHMFPCLSDNYGFLVHDRQHNLTASIDTPDVAAIVRQLDDRGWQLTHILNTHHHWDHAGGNLELKKKYDCRIIGAGHDAARIPGIDRKVREGDSFRFGDHEVQVRETPGHTTGHIVYYFPAEKILFAGDTLFSVGCGRLFEGTPGQMWSSLQKIMQLPEDTLIYCAHEYTLNNIDFARSIDRDNPDLEAYYSEAKALRAENKPTIPTTLARELRVNPFLHPSAPGIVKTLAARAGNDLDNFTVIRKLKDSF